MILYGYAKDTQWTGEGTMRVRVRIPSIHGPFFESDRGSTRGMVYVKDADLPYIESLLLPYTPKDGDVVALMTTSDDISAGWIIIGLTGGNYYEIEARS